jgi:hypothetical protein
VAAKSSCPEGRNLVARAVQVLKYENNKIDWDEKSSYFTVIDGVITHEEWMNSNAEDMPKKKESK